MTQVNEKGKTFAVMARGNAITFSAAKLKALPKGRGDDCHHLQPKPRRTDGSDDR